MPRIMLALKDVEMEKLIELSKRERRHPRDQGAILLAKIMNELCESAPVGKKQMTKEKKSEK